MFKSHLIGFNKEAREDSSSDKDSYPGFKKKIPGKFKPRAILSNFWPIIFKHVRVTEVKTRLSI